MKALVVSPHLDDAALSAGQMMCVADNVIVLTVLAGLPPEGTRAAYDGGEDSRVQVSLRRDEDIRACTVLGAMAVHGDLLDAQYGFPVTVGQVTELIEATARVVQPDVIIGPLGIQHPDHLLVSDGFLASTTGAAMWLYEDLPYRVLNPETATDRYSELRSKGFAASPDGFPSGPLWAKQAAVACYRTQLHGLGDDIQCVWVPERFWRLTDG